jgi:hypothetical protein
MVNNATNWPAATTVSGITTKLNGVAITFPNPTGNWGLIICWGAFVASSGGTPEFFNPLDTGITPQNGNTPVQFGIGQLILPWD